MRKKLEELRQKSIEELRVSLAEKRRKLAQARLDLKLKRIKNVHKSRFVRKEITRILTIIKEKELMGGG